MQWSSTSAGQSVCRREGSSLSFTGCSPLPGQPGNTYLCSAQQNASSSKVPGHSSPSPWQGPAECCRGAGAVTRSVQPGLAWGSNTAQQPRRGAQEPCQPCSAPGGVVVVQLGDLCFLLTTDNHSKIEPLCKTTYMIFPVVCAIHGRVIQCLSHFPADSIHTK